MQKLYRAKKTFSSALVGGKIPGDVFVFGEESAKKWIEDGLIEPVEMETKPQELKKSKKAKK